MFPVSFLIGTITLTCVSFGLFVLAWAHCRKQGFFSGYDPFSLKPFFIVLTFSGIWLAPSILVCALWLSLAP